MIKIFAGCVFAAMLLAGCRTPVPSGPAPTCDAACQSYARACPQAAAGCVDLCTAVTNPGFRACLAHASDCDAGNRCDDALQGQ